MEDIIIRLGEDLLGRMTGPMEFRLYLQPAVAVLYAFRDGRRDALTGRSPYLWSLATNYGGRIALLREGWQSVARIFILAILIDLIYQHLALPEIYPGEALIASFILAVIPYLLLRGPVNRFWPRR